MRIWILGLLLAATAASAQTLFDGKTLNGWEARSTSAPPGTGDWKIENGALVCGGGGGQGGGQRARPGALLARRGLGKEGKQKICASALNGGRLRPP